LSFGKHYSNLLEMSALEALADPVRLRIVRHLVEHDGASLEELADAVGVHPNTARPHLASLEEAGVVERVRQERRGRGRPRVGYRLARDWTLDGQRSTGLPGLLAAALLRAAPSAEELRTAGNDWGRYLVGRPGAHDPRRGLPIALGALGYDARVNDGTLELSACPCPVVSPSRPEQICQLADGVIDGVLSSSGGTLRAGTAVHDPERRRCTVGLVGRAGDGQRRRGRKRT
jgi:DNA-binding transcriptional ArsR family regulator